jgi:5'-deoxynucleotidase
MSHLFAYLARMKLITRWPLMHNVKTENVQEHSLQVSMIAHALALIANKKFKGTFDPYKIATIAMFHDASEVFTGDMPTPIKYYNPNITTEYKKIEVAAEKKLLSMVPDIFKKDYETLITLKDLSDEEKGLIKSADTIAAYLKCIEEIQLGNHEFQPPYKRLKQTLESSSNQEILYFLEQFVPSFHLSFDEISGDL